MFHLADGDRDSFVDQHRNLGRGNYDIGGMLQRIPPGACLTLEAEKTPHLSLRDFEEDVLYVRKRLS